MERIRDFVAALRSGEYKQAKGRLRTNLKNFETGELTGEVGFCCEGVALLRYGTQLGYTVEVDDDGDLNGSHKYGADHEFEFTSFTVAPPRFWDDMGMRNTDVSNGFVFELPRGCRVGDTSTEWEEYASLNDSGFTFDQIADLIQWQFLSDPEVPA